MRSNEMTYKYTLSYSPGRRKTRSRQRGIYKMGTKRGDEKRGKRVGRRAKETAR